jgi:hypothetical protein
VRINANFLNGEAYAFDAPEWLEPSPTLETIVTYDNRPRFISYVAYSRRAEPAKDSWLAHQFDVRSGLTTASVYRTLDGSDALVAYWRFPAGALATFMQDDYECGGDYVEAGIRTVIANTDVTVSRLGYPVITLGPPLKTGNPREPHQRERMRFWPIEDPNASQAANVLLTREPPWVPEGRSIQRGGEHAFASETGALGVTVTAFGPKNHADRFERYAHEIAASIAPVS